MYRQECDASRAAGLASARLLSGEMRLNLKNLDCELEG